MPLLTIETTCDETAAAVVERSGKVLGSAVATQEKLHERFTGVVPEIASRAHVERILPVIDETLRQSGVPPERLTAIAVAHTPGLAGSLLVGVVAAKTLSVVWDKPLVAINHLHAHLYACQLTVLPRDIYPCIGLIVSGGHTSLYRAASPLDLKYLGGTIDDAAGEAFDKVAAMLRLGFPGGPAVSRLAATGDPQAFRFPRAMIHDANFDFSFSGLKTAVRYAIAGPGKVDFDSLQISDGKRADLCASFEAAVVDCLVTKSIRAVRQHAAGLTRSDAPGEPPRLCVGGGVAANPRLRQSLEAACDAAGIELIIAPPELCTDNAVMGAIGWEKVIRGDFAPLNLDIQPGLQRGH
ncbi:MAG: tRNA (adenosine(37)-N6)-threonylcarbamoyltransferase complex transferase subunit TsaD [Planctomycetaceae bacterium]|nr:MAG: tRNA (adenosine(37)-N6)-threonylcarbamoyltransferase complex transferase subunit TsaD [Planctomycetaceae bacterium]